MHVAKLVSVVRMFQPSRFTRDLVFNLIHCCCRQHLPRVHTFDVHFLLACFLAALVWRHLQLQENASLRQMKSLRGLFAYAMRHFKKYGTLHLSQHSLIPVWKIKFPFTTMKARFTQLTGKSDAYLQKKIKNHA